MLGCASSAAVLTLQIDGLAPYTNYSISMHANYLANAIGSPETAPVVFSTKAAVGADIKIFRAVGSPILINGTSDDYSCYSYDSFSGETYINATWSVDERIVGPVERYACLSLLLASHISVDMSCLQALPLRSVLTTIRNSQPISCGC